MEISSLLKPSEQGPGKFESVSVIRFPLACVYIKYREEVNAWQVGRPHVLVNTTCVRQGHKRARFSLHGTLSDGVISRGMIPCVFEYDTPLHMGKEKGIYDLTLDLGCTFGAMESYRYQCFVFAHKTCCWDRERREHP